MALCALAGMARAALALLAAATLGLVSAQNVSCTNPLSGNIYGYSATLLNGSTIDFTAFAGQVVLVVNVASF